MAKAFSRNTRHEWEGFERDVRKPQFTAEVGFWNGTGLVLAQSGGRDMGPELDQITRNLGLLGGEQARVYLTSVFDAYRLHI